MSFRLAINGYGRIGRSILRALYAHYRHDLIIALINEISALDTMAYLTRYDTTQGRFPGTVDVRGSTLVVEGDTIVVSHEKNTQKINWTPYNIDLLLECSGSFTSRAIAQHTIDRGIPKLLFSQPATPKVDKTIVFGVNEQELSCKDQIVSAASCTTNCIVPVLKILKEALGIECGLITTIHSAMNDQPITDACRQKGSLRLTRAALASIIPVETALAKGIDRLLPELAGCIEANAIRVPTLNVSAIDLTVHISKSISAKALNQLLRESAQNPALQALLGYTEEPHASIDFNHDSRSCIIDGSQTKVCNGKLLKILCWFDNEWGFANRMLDIAHHWLTCDQDIAPKSAHQEVSL